VSSRSLNEWLSYIATVSYTEIDLGVERVQAVADRLFAQGIGFTYIAVAGTNGKGSTCELISSIYRSAGYKVGKYSSPHLVSISERFQVNGVDCSDQALCDAFEQIEALRATVLLTEFEYLTLAAVVIFAQGEVDIAVMEVGLGGRLDAVNAFDPDLSVITSIGLDHQDWLGDTLEAIGAEKAGVMRDAKVCVLGSRTMPSSIKQAALESNAKLLQLGGDYTIELNSSNSNSDANTVSADDSIGSWDYRSKIVTAKDKHLSGHRHLVDLLGLPIPFDKSPVSGKLSRDIAEQDVYLQNAASAITAVLSLSHDHPVEQHNIGAGIASASLAGRCQIVHADPYVILDVGHNPSALAQLNRFYRSLNVTGNTYAICGFLKDKAIGECLELFKGAVDSWVCCSTNGSRGLSGTQLSDIARQYIARHDGLENIKSTENLELAFRDIKASLNKDDCLLVFGSFQVVGDIIRALNDDVDSDIM